jgi:molybdopterin-containing oxidoreductase family iron-sulfur binding subunit
MGFSDALKKVRNTVRLGLYEDETSMQCRWHIPQAHYLEAWGDIRAFDGTTTIMQPLIAPLYGGRTPAEMLAAFTDNPDRTSYDIVQNYWRTQFPAATFDQSWRTAVHDGIVANSTLPVRGGATRAAAVPAATTAQQKQGLELVIRPDSAVYDGRFSNNAWLQELPKTHTKLTWDNAAVMSPDTAQRLGVSSEDVVELTYMGRTTRAPVSVNPGFANDSVVLHLGYGRKRAGTIGTGIGVDAYQFRTSAQPGGGAGLQIRKTGDMYPLATTKEHHPLHDRTFENRQIIRSQRLDQFNSDPEFVRKEDESPPKSLSLYPEFDYARQSYAWGMSINQTACVGCNACVIACVAENNIPVVGKDQV